MLFELAEVMNAKLKIKNAKVKRKSELLILHFAFLIFNFAFISVVGGNYNAAGHERERARRRAWPDENVVA